MVLQYRGWKNNWNYEEAEQISSGYVDLRNIIKETASKDYGDSLEKYQAVQDAIFDYIDEEIGSFEAKKILHTEEHLMDLNIVVVVVLEDSNKRIARIFSADTDIYLLNSRGQTVQKLS